MFDNYFDYARPGWPYTHSLPVLPGTFPASNATREEEKPEAPEGYHPGWNGKEWVNLENHIGKQGWVDGESVTIKEYGPLPEDWSADPPPQPFDPGPDYEKQEDGSFLRVRYTKKDFMLWCGMDKLVALNAAISAGNVLVKTVLDLLMAAEYINIKDPDTAQMLGALTTAEGGSLLTVAEMQRILAGQVVAPPVEIENGAIPA